MFIIYVILLNCSLLTLKLDRCANDLKMLSSQLRSIETRKHYPIKENVINSAKKIYLKLENLIEKQPTSLFSNKDTFMIDMFSVYCKFANEIKRRFIGSIDHRTFCKALEELCFECKNLQAKRKKTTRKKEN